MDRCEPAWEYDGHRDWPESVWAPPEDAPASPDEAPVLFADPLAELELRREIRLSELWGRCKSGTCVLDEFFELSALISEVDAIPDVLCVDCAMLDRPNASPNWAVAATMRCRAHLRFHLGHTRLDGDGGVAHR